MAMGLQVSGDRESSTLVANANLHSIGQGNQGKSISAIADLGSVLEAPMTVEILDKYTQVLMNTCAVISIDMKTEDQAV